MILCARSSTDRASDYGSEGSGFESLRAHHLSWKFCYFIQPSYYFAMQSKFQSVTQYFLNFNFDKNFFKFLLVLVSFIYSLYLTYLGAVWRIDPHHDGYTYISAYLGTLGILPPLTANHHGIAAPLLESKFLLLTSTSLINYRFLALMVICITALILFKIINQRSGLLIASIFTLLWLNANPSWAGSIKGSPNQLQSIWPNMWIQLLTVFAVLIIFSRNQVKNFHQITLGIVVCSLPFFRIQGLFTTIFLCALIYVKYRSHLYSFVISGFFTLACWLSLIQVNGGIKRYFANIIINPFTVSDYAPWRSPESIFMNLGHKAKYFIVVSLLLLFLAMIITLIKKYAYFNDGSNVLKEITLLFVLAATIILLTFQNRAIWWNSLYENFTILLIDSTIIISFIYISLTLTRFVKLKNLSLNDHQKELLFLSFLVLLNVINQFPLSDRGHKWWASAPSVLLLASLLTAKSNAKLNYWNKLDWASSLKLLAIFSILFSTLEGRIFQQINRIEIANYKYANFNGLQYPLKDSESVNNLLSSVKILTELENRGITINYLCEDGLYHIRDKGYTEESLKSLNKDIDNFPSVVTGVVFYCNAGIYQLPSLLNFNIYTIGKNKTDLFIAPKNNVLVNSILLRLLNL